MTVAILPLDLSPLWISLKVASLATVMTFFLGIAAARWMLRYRGRGRSLIENVFVAPLILPPTVVGFLLLLLFGKNGPVGQLMAPWNLSIIFTWYAAVITATVVSFPLMYKTALGAFEQVDPTLLQVAQTLGASEREIFWRVLLPLSLPGLIAGTVLAFARSLGEFGATLMLAGNIPGLTQTMPMAIYFAVEAGAMTEAWFWVLLILAISFTAILLVNGWQRIYQQRSQRRSGRTSSPPLSEQSATVPAIADQESVRRSPLEGTASDRGLAIALHKPLPHFSLDIAFTAEQGTVGLLGASGSGKSMTLRCIAGVETPTQGQICLNGRILFDAKRGINLPSHHRQVGLVFQNYALFPHMTVAENIGFGLQHLSAVARSQRVQQQLALVQLDHFGDRYPHQLSGGQQQRVALARALAIDPDILLLDEPFSALDTHLRSELEKQLIQTLSTYQGLTLFVSHNLEEAYRVCQTLLVLDRGRVLAYDEKQAIFSQPGSVAVAKLTGCKNYSTMHRLSTNLIQAADWNCTLQTHETVSDRHTHVGIRAHQITFFPDSNQPNTFLAWVAWTSETPHRMTLFLKLCDPPISADDYHLQAEVFKNRWQELNKYPMPWKIALEPHKLLLLTAD